MTPPVDARRKLLQRIGRGSRAARLVLGSLRVKAGLAIVAAFAAGFTLLAAIVMYSAEQETRQLIGNQQTVIARNVANDIDEKVAMARDMLLAMARRLPLDELHDARAMESFIRANDALFEMFNDVVVFRPSGTPVADWPAVPGRRTTDYSFRDYFKSPLATGQPYVSPPFMAKLHQTPIIVIAVPVLDPAGKPVTVISGLVHLLRPNFLGRLATRRIGDSGYFVLTDGDGTIMIHPRPHRIMTQASRDGSGAAIERARNGSQGHYEGHEAKLYAASIVKSTDWTLLAVLPQNEAYRPLAPIRARLAIIFVALLAALGVLFWLLMGRLLAPLTALKTAVQAYGAGADRAAPLDLGRVPRGSAEIDAVADALRRAVERTETTATRLREEQAFSNAVVEHAGTLVLVLDREGRFVRFNRACEELSGYSFAEVEGKFPWDTVLPTEDANTIKKQAFEALARDPQAHSGRYTNYWVTKARERRLIEWHNTLLLDAGGAMQFMVSVGIDVTERGRIAAREATRLAQLKELSALGLMLSGDPGAVFERVADLIGRLFKVRVVCLSEIVGGALFFRTVYVDGKIFRDAGDCPLENTPCATVGEARDLRIYDRVMERFPRASFLRDYNAFAYCGFPSLDHDGRVVAVTCLLDDKPHEFNEEDQQLLRVIGQRIAVEIEHGKLIDQRKRKEQALRESEARLLSLFEHSPISVWEEDFSELKARMDSMRAEGVQDYRAYLDAHPEEVLRCAGLVKIVDVNQASVELFQADSKEQISRDLPGYFTDESLAVFKEELIALAESRTRFQSEITIRVPRGGLKRLHLSLVVIPGYEASLSRVLLSFMDITDRKQAEDRIRAALAEKEVLLKEIYHRVKNNLQVVSSLLNMQGRGVSDAGMKELLAESANRVKSMALVHEQLYRSGDLSNISLAEYLRQLAEHLSYAHRLLSARVPVRLEVADLRFGIETAVPLGLIVNELVSNAYKHGYGADTVRGEIVLRIEGLDDGQVRLEVTDDGRGLPEGFEPKAVSSLGMQLVVTLAAQLAGELRHRSEAGRTSFEVVFRPEAREAERLVA
jgi:PAS domain S-box-containing protein